MNNLKYIFNEFSISFFLYTLPIMNQKYSKRNQIELIFFQNFRWKFPKPFLVYSFVLFLFLQDLYALIRFMYSAKTTSCRFSLLCANISHNLSLYVKPFYISWLYYIYWNIRIYTFFFLICFLLSNKCITIYFLLWSFHILWTFTLFFIWFFVLYQ